MFVDIKGKLTAVSNFTPKHKITTFGSSSKEERMLAGMFIDLLHDSAEKALSKFMEESCEDYSDNSIYVLVDRRVTLGYSLTNRLAHIGNKQVHNLVKDYLHSGGKVTLVLNIKAQVLISPGSSVRSDILLRSTSVVVSLKDLNNGGVKLVLPNGEEIPLEVSFLFGKYSLPNDSETSLLIGYLEKYSPVV